MNFMKFIAITVTLLKTRVIIVLYMKETLQDPFFTNQSIQWLVMKMAALATTYWILNSSERTNLILAASPSSWLIVTLTATAAAAVLLCCSVIFYLLHYSYTCILTIQSLLCLWVSAAWLCEWVILFLVLGRNFWCVSAGNLKVIKRYQARYALLPRVVRNGQQ